MAIVTTPATALTLAGLVTRIRVLCGDVSSTSVNNRFSDTQIRYFIDFILAQMWLESTQDPSGFLESVAITYTGSAESIALAAGFEAQSIYKVEDITDSSTPIVYEYMSQLDVDKYPLKQGWTLQGLNIVIRPKPTGTLALRIWRVKTFPRTIDAATSDQHSLPIDHEELICLGCAVKLQQIDGEADASQIVLLDKLWDSFRSFAKRLRGPAYVRNARKYK